MLAFLKKYEFWLAMIFIIFIITLFNLGFFIAIFQADANKFTGIIGIPKTDKAVYISMIEQIKQGSLLNDNLFTSELQTYKLLHPLWLLLGVVARWLHISSLIIFHIANFVSGLVFLSVLYIISKKFFDLPSRFLFLTGLGFFGGLGRITILFSDVNLLNGELFYKLLPVDMWFSEGFGFMTLYHSPLFILSQLLVVLGWWWLVKSFKYSYKYSFFASGAVLLFGIIHPYDVLSWWAVSISLVFLIFFRKDFTGQVIIQNIIPSIISTGVIIIYYLFLLVNEPVLADWHKQNITLPPSFFGLLTGYGLLWVFSIIGLVYILKNKKGLVYDWLIIWFLTLPFLLLVPINIARRFMATFGIVIVIMSVFGLRYFWENYFAKFFQKRIFTYYIGSTILFMIIILLVMSPLYQIIESVDDLNKKEFPTYISTDDAMVLNFFKNTKINNIILAQSYLSSYIPAFTGRRVWSGHVSQTINFFDKKIDINRFYITTWDDWHNDFLQKNNIDYVIWPTNRVAELPEDMIIDVHTNSLIILKIINNLIE